MGKVFLETLIWIYPYRDFPTQTPLSNPVVNWDGKSIPWNIDLDISVPWLPNSDSIIKSSHKLGWEKYSRNLDYRAIIMQASLCRFFFFWLIFLPCLFISFLASIKNANTVFHLQGISAVKAFYELLSQSCLSILHSEENKPVAPVELCPILKTLYNILIARYLSSSPTFLWIYKSLIHPFTLRDNYSLNAYNLSKFSGRLHHRPFFKH